MKTLLFLMFFFFFVSNSSAQQKTQITFGDLVFGDEEFVKVGVSLPKDELLGYKDIIRQSMQAQFTAGTHPFAWVNPSKVEFLWIVDGPLRSVYEALKKAPAGTTKPAWIHKSVASTNLTLVKVSLEAGSAGRVELYSGDLLVGQFACRSGTRTDGSIRQPDQGIWSLKTCTESGTGLDKGEMGRMSRKHNSWMSWAHEIRCPKNLGCFLHAGELESESDSCIRISRAVAKYLYTRIGSKTKIEIVYE